MGCCTRRTVAAVAVALVASGCFSGHLLDAARRREQVLTVQEAFVGDDALVLRYATVERNDAGRPVGRGERWAAIPLSEVRAGDRPIDTLHVTWLDAAEARRRADRPIAVARAAAGAPSVEIVTDDGRDAAVILHEPTGDTPPLDTRAFTRVHVLPWAYPLLPFTLAVDAVGTPALLLFSPVVIVPGD
jgi:hypothetical protein